MRNKQFHIIRSSALRRLLFGKKIKSEKLSIKDSTTEFFEDIPLHRKTAKKNLKVTKPRSRRNQK